MLKNFTKRQMEILTKSIHLLAETGFANLSIRNIAKSVGIDEATIYSHFKSKDEILNTILNIIMNDSVESFNKFDLAETSLIKRLKMYFDKYTKSSEEENAIISIFWYAFVKIDESYFKRISEIYAYHRQWLINTVEQGQENNEIKNDFSPDNLVAFISGYLSMYSRRCLYLHDYKLEANIHESWKIIEMMLTGR